MYDGRLGRRWNIDPLYFYFPNISPYATFADNPIYYNDPLGLAPSGDGGKRRPGQAKGISKQAKDSHKRTGFKGYETGTSDPKPRNNKLEGENPLARKKPTEPNEKEEPLTPKLDEINVVERPKELPKDIPPTINAKLGFSENTNQFKNYLEGSNILDPIGDLLKKYPDVSITVVTNVAVGKNHSKSLGSTVDYLNNSVIEKITAKDLMLHRADAIKEYLRQYGISPDRIKTEPGKVLEGEPGLNSTIQFKP